MTWNEVFNATVYSKSLSGKVAHMSVYDKIGKVIRNADIQLPLTSAGELWIKKFTYDHIVSGFHVVFN